ncbi:MAG: RNA polymerase factor sigma-54 [Thermodesulfobacteriota bacterium]
MALEVRQQLRQTQQLVMTPQLQQAIKLLQYNHMEMVDALEHELRENPLLEVGTFEEPFTAQEAPTRNDLESIEDLAKEPQAPNGGDVLSAEWGLYIENYGGDTSRVARDDDKRRSFEDLLTYGNTLFKHLLDQLQMSHIEGEDRRIALQIIGNVEDRGYLDASLEELAESLKVSVEEVERVLGMVQQLEPAGVAARTLQECLTIQARLLDPECPNVIAVLTEAFDLFHAGKLDVVARKLRLSLEEVQDAARTISRLDPRPGRNYSGKDVIYPIPDVYVIKVGSDYSVVLNNDGVPRLKINPLYHNRFQPNTAAVGAKDYIQEKMRGAIWLIKSIHQRQRTIYKVAESIVKFQREFFDKGIDYLRPLILRDVAEDIEMHESTISRVTTNKYMDSPQGIFELKFFFNSGIPHGSESIASEAVKKHILRLIKKEDPKKPASDKQIVEELARADITIARRTVAKYREELGIPPSSQRKKKF